MVLNIESVVTQSNSNCTLGEGYVDRKGFIFISDDSNSGIYDRIVIRSSPYSKSGEANIGYSTRTLEEHIELINEYQIKKAYVICENLDFILKCPSINDLEIFPSFDAENNFDYSVLYKICGLKRLACNTVYGDCEQYKTTLDYARIKGLEIVSMYGTGHIGFEKVPTLRKIYMSGNKKIRSLSKLSCSSVLQELTVFGCGIQSLRGIEDCKKLESLTLCHNYALQDISTIKSTAYSLKELSIDACSKIKDFTVLNYLKNLEYLYLEGNNTIPNLDFLKKMKLLKVLSFTMNIEDGDLSNCVMIPYVSCRNRKHYNRKDEELSKELSKK